MKTAEEILYENGIDKMSLNDEFNCLLLKSIEEYAEQKLEELKKDGVSKRIIDDMKEAETKAIDSLSRYKFSMFGYWAGIWVHLNRISGLKKPNPFKAIVIQAKIMKVDAST